VQEECGSFPADSGVSLLNVMHSLSLLPNNCPEDQQPDEQERFIPLLVDAIVVKSRCRDLLSGTARSHWLSSS